MTTERKLTIQAASVLAIVVMVVASFILMHTAALTRFTEFEARQDGQRVLRDMQRLEKIEPSAIVAPTARGCPAGSHVVYHGEDYDCRRDGGSELQPAEADEPLCTSELLSRCWSTPPAGPCPKVCNARRSNELIDAIQIRKALFIPVPYACKVWTWSDDRLAYVCSTPR